MASRRDSLLKHAIADGYNPLVEGLRATEYPQLNEITYLDHAGTTLYATSLIHSFSEDLCANLYGNPHSPSPSSQKTTKRIDDIRHRVLHLFNADPEQFDIVFCANATAGMKLVLEAFTAQEGGFEYRYHVDAHTSLVGVRELANEATCFSSDAEVEIWLKGICADSSGLFGWPAQSNFSGRRLPRDWAVRLRDNRPGWYSLLDAAALVTSAPLDLSDARAAPDFTVLSFYKMFGFPDLGALIIRKGSADILQSRRYFGGGTVDAVVSRNRNFHARKAGSIHAHLEDGTLAFHSILALDIAISTHKRLYGSFDNISRHAFSLTQIAHSLLSELAHGNRRKLCQIYTSGGHISSVTQGPIIAFNMQRADGSWIGYAEVEKLASVKNIHIRTGGMCNPGGIETSVGLEPWEIEQNYLAGHRCWDEQDVMHGKPTGAIRVSLGAMSTIDDLIVFVTFLEEFYLDKEPVSLALQGPPIGKSEAVVESLTIYPIKSCGGFNIPPGECWEIRPHGFAWDREWCLVHLGTGSAIDQKRYNKMALIRPRVDLISGYLEVYLHNSSAAPLKIPLSLAPSASCTLKSSRSRVCGDEIAALTYTSPHITDFFTSAVGVPCTLARFPAVSENRHFKPRLKASSFIQEKEGRIAPILLSNESPILLINSSSIDKLNETIRSTGGKLAKPEVFRGNIVVRETTVANRAYAEDFWKHVKIGQEYFQLLGPCRRCHMVCVDQETAEKNEEPYVTLVKTRRIDGRVLFGQHAMHLPLQNGSRVPGIRVGDVVRVWQDGDGEEVNEDCLAGQVGVA